MGVIPGIGAKYRVIAQARMRTTFSILFSRGSHGLLREGTYNSFSAVRRHDYSLVSRYRQNFLVNIW